MNNSESSPAADPYVELAADIVSAYVSHNSLRPNEVIDFLKDVVSAIKQGASQEATAKAPIISKADIRKSLSDEFIVSFEDGKRYKTLKRHLSMRGLTPDQYREKWGLPADYPMVAPSYAARRSEMAKKIGLGLKPGTRTGRARKK